MRRREDKEEEGGRDCTSTVRANDTLDWREGGREEGREEERAGGERTGVPRNQR